MLLIELKTFLADRKRASLDDLARRFDTDPGALKGMMETWIAKGRVRRLSDRLPCGTCGKCESAQTDIYEWVGADGCPDPAAARAAAVQR
ncbi:MAG: FeoC-like transcriptional regulator [Rhodospirillaceae bacterium]|nr:FeoC-like transcriptional regulator [Rhodospirillaceae bacterium]